MSSGQSAAYKAALDISYNRPFDGAVSTDPGASYICTTEVSDDLVLEKNRYDLSYTSSSDIDPNGPLLLNHRIFMSSAHDGAGRDGTAART